MKVRKSERVKTLLASGVRVFDLYDLMDRMGTVTFRFTKKYINVPLTAAATGLLGNQVGGDAFDWQKLIYTPLFITAGICVIGLALKIPNFLSSAKRNFARLQGHLNMVQLKRSRRVEHAKVLWDRHFVYHTREKYSATEITTAEKAYAESRVKLADELEQGLSEESIDHLELENLSGTDRRAMIEELAAAMEYETPTSPGVEKCEAAFFRTLFYSLRSDEAQQEKQERSGYVFREYKSWILETFFDSSRPPLAKIEASDFRIRRIKAQLKKSGVAHEVQVRQSWYAFHGLAQSFWHLNTIRKVNLKIGVALSRLSRKYQKDLTVQSILWPGNWRHTAFQITASDGSLLADELRDAARETIRMLYGAEAEEARQMLERAMLNNFMETKGLRVLADYAYCSGSGLDQSYLEDLKQLGCSEELFAYHEAFVQQAGEAMKCFDAWLDNERPELREQPLRLAVLQDAFHRNWKGLRELIAEGENCNYNLRPTLTRRIAKAFRRAPDAAMRIVNEVISEEGVAEFREERDAMRIYDAVAHLEYDTYLDLIYKLGEYEEGAAGS